MSILKGRALLCLVLACLLLSGVSATAEPLPVAIAESLPAAELRGTATARWFGIALYDAALWMDRAMPAGAEDYSIPFLLRLRFARSFSGRAIADASRAEIASLHAPAPEQLAQWHARMLAACPDVEAGTELAGMHIPGVGMRLFYNGVVRADLPGDDFSRAFFGIWLDRRTRYAGVRAQLLATGAP